MAVKSPENSTVIQTIPTSEAAAERPFVVLPGVFKGCVCALCAILDAQLAIPIWQICEAPDRSATTPANAPWRSRTSDPLPSSQRRSDEPIHPLPRCL
jgi:hypothetical protein